jgi:hypothetical protein
MLKPSPLKHKEDGHDVLDQVAHDKAHSADENNTEAKVDDKIDLTKPIKEDLGPKEVKIDDSSIRLIGDDELEMEEEEAVEYYRNAYGHLGFTFDESGVGDNVTIRHPNDDGDGVTISHDQWTSMGNKALASKFNNYISKYTKDLSKEQISKTHVLPTAVNDIVNINNEKLTDAEKEEIATDASKVMNDETYMQKASNFFESAAMSQNAQALQKAGGTGSLGHLALSKGFDFIAGALDNKSNAEQEARDIIQDKCDPESPNYDEAYASSMNDKAVLKKEFNKISLQQKVKENEKNLKKEKVSDVLNDLDPDEKEYAENRAQERIEELSPIAKENELNFKKVLALNNSYEQNLTDYNSDVEKLRDDLLNDGSDKRIKDYQAQALEKYQAMVNSGDMTVEEANAAINSDVDGEVSLIQKERQARINKIKGAGGVLDQNRKLIESLKGEYAESFIEGSELDDLLVAEDYLDNINNSAVNLLATVGAHAEDFGGTLLHLAGSLEKGGLGLAADGLSKMSGVDPEVFKNLPAYKMLETHADGAKLLGDYLKKNAEEHKTYLKDLPPGFDMSTFVEKALIGVAENLPQLALASLTGGGSIAANMAVYGLSGAGQKHYDMEKENIERVKKGEAQYTTQQMILAPISAGAFESVTMVPEMLMMRGALKGAGKFNNPKLKVTGNSLYTKMGEGILGFGKATVLTEVPQEVFTQIGNNATDKYFLGKDDVNLYDGMDADFFIKVIGSSGTFYTAPRAIAGAMHLTKGMGLVSDQESMLKNSKELIDVKTDISSIEKEISKLKPNDPKVKPLLEQQATLQTKLDNVKLKSEKTISDILGRYGKMDTPSINKLRTLATKGAKLQVRARDIKADNSISRKDKRSQLKDLQTQFEAIEADKGKIINNKNKYKLEHGNKRNRLEKEALTNLRDKNKGKEPTKEQIEAEAERINDETNINADKRVNDAKLAVADNVRKFGTDKLINQINSFDPTKPIEKFEGETVQEARDWLRNTLTEKGLSKTDIQDQVDQLTDASWSTGKEGASAYMFSPKFKDAKPDPDTHMFDKHQIMIVNSAKSRTGANFAARGHEVLHAIAYKGLKASGKAFAPMADAMSKKIAASDPAGIAWLDQRMEAYKSKNGTELDDAYHEEVVMAISDGMRSGNINRTSDAVLGIRNAINKGMAIINPSKANDKLMINDAQDMLDVIADYGRGVDKGGEMSVDIQKLAKGEVVLGDDIAIDRTAQRKSNEATRAKMSMDNLSREAKEIVTESINASRKVKAGDVNDAFDNFSAGNIDSFAALTEIGKAYDPMFNKAIKQFEDENNIKFGPSQKDTFKFEAVYGDRGLRGALFFDPDSPRKVFDPNVQVVIDGKKQNNKPAKYLNGLLPQRMIEFGVKAIPNLDEYYAKDLDALKEMEATETADMTMDQEVVKTRDKRDLSSLAVASPSVIAEVKLSIAKIISRSMVDAQATAKTILDDIMNIVEKKIAKLIVKEMGTINTVGDRVIPSDEYKAFHANSFETIVKALPIKTIKKKYSKLFNIDKIGREKDKKVNPITGKVTYPGKGIFQITPIPKAQFGSYFLNGKLTTLRARQAALATEIGQSLAKDATYLIAKDPKIIDKISQMRDIQGMSTVVGIQNEINEIANQLDKKKDEGGSLDVVKLAKDLGKLDDNVKQDYFKGLSVLGNAYLNSGHSMIGAFNKAFPSPMFGEYRESILKDTVKYMEQYERQNSKYKEVGIKPSETIADFITNEVLMKDQLKAVKAQYGLGKGMVDAKNLEQLDSVRSAAAKIAQELGIEKADRFLGFMASTGKNGGTSALANPKTGKLELAGAEFYLSKIEKEQARTGLTAKQQKVSDAKIEKYSKAIAEGKEPTSHPYGYFAGIGDFANVVLKGLSGYTNKYKSPIAPNAAQNVGVVNNNFSFEANKKSADVNADFLVELMDVMVKLNNTLDANGNPVISKNDMAMIQMSLGNGGMNTPLAAAANVAFMTNDGNKNSTDHIYEHLIPRRVINAALAGYANGTMTKPELKTLLDQFQVAVIPREQADIVDKFFKSSMPADWMVGVDVLNRYFNMRTFGDINMPLVDLKTGEVNAKSKVFADAANALKPKDQVKQSKDLSKAISESRIVKEPKGITVLDFDDTLATSKSLIRYTKPDGTKGTLNAEQYAKTYQELTDLGYEWDFSEFTKVVDGKTAPLFNKAMKLQGKFGPENMFILTARPAESATAIFEFLQANGLNIPMENITGLGNSTGKAKADWIAGKVADGYNDFYFADDAMQNVKAVQDMLDQFDVKSKVQLAKVKFSKDISPTFNDILESTTGVESQKEFSDAQARLRGRDTEYKGIIPASAQDFQGLLYNFLGKGKQGEADMAFFKKALIDPFARGIKELNTSRQSAATDFENLNKNFPEVKKILNKNIEGLDYTNDQAIRVYLWNKAGFEVPGLSKRDLAALTSIVQNDPEMQAYADAIGLISKKDDGYSKPKDYWLAESIASDLLSDGAIGDVRAEFLGEWQQNVDQMFSKANLNKIEAVYGSKFREALEDSLYRMRTGKNRPTGGGRLMNGYMNWVNNSVGAIMFFNMRSAILQTISATNYMNWSFNNPAKAAAAFANQPQFWKDFSMIFNSPYLKQRRSGNQRGINEAELSEAVAGSENKAKTAIAWLLKKGFLPTQLADSFAIASGGASFYRNKVKALVKEGMSQEQAETQAFLEFQEVTEVSQQSARPDMISQQQASPLGRLILSFQNTPMQYARIINKAARDLANGRGDYKTHMSKIAYYGVAQGILFGSLQSALFAALGDDEEEEYDKKKERIINGMIDSLLSGIGYGGKAISTAKNTIREYAKQKDKGWNADHTYTILQLLGFSPPIGSKLRKIYGSIQTEQFNQGVFKKRGLTLDNPIWSAVGNVVEGVTNVPLGRLAQKMLNIDNALDDNNKWWERAALLLGWNTWDLGIKDKDITAVKDEIKEEKKIESKEKQKIKKEQKKKEKEKENKAVIEDNKKKSKKDGVCSAVSKGGKRCKTKVVEGKLFCTVHEKAEQNETGEKSQCKKIKKGNKRCKMQTSNKSGYCYYHD